MIIFQKIKGTWRKVLSIQSVQSTANDYFGWSVAIYNSYIAIGNNCQGGNLYGSHCTEAVYIYTVACGTASYQQTLLPVSTTAVSSLTNITYGTSIGMNDKVMTVGAPSASKYLLVLFSVF